jgi:hypothetical protein
MDGILTDPKATSHYLWNAIQRRVLSYLITQKEVDANRIGALFMYTNESCVPKCGADIRY